RPAASATCRSSRRSPERRSLTRRPARAAEELRLPAVAVAEALDHPAPTLRSQLALREEAGEELPVLDPLEQDDLVMAPGARSDRPARGDRDHAGVPCLRVEDRPQG